MNTSELWAFALLLVVTSFTLWSAWFVVKPSWNLKPRRSTVEADGNLSPRR
ncbi:MAG: hypothetical protein PHI35_05660 [Victivallaceae bacterium]|nr:hypothetical protein [Victivallaceae bacterium]